MKTRLDQIADMISDPGVMERFLARRDEHSPNDPRLFTPADLLAEFAERGIPMSEDRLSKWLANSMSWAQLLPHDENRLLLKYHGHNDFRPRLRLTEVDSLGYFIESVIPSVRRNSVENGKATQFVRGRVTKVNGGTIK
jgi:hypothetical protein